jgi:uroporphyrinogen-III synthase
MKPLVIVRPEPGASTTARMAEQLGLSTRVMPLFAIEAVHWQAPDAAQFDALLLTSANAIRHGGSELARLRSLPVHCVGEATGSAARDAGFDIASIGTHGVDVLLDSIPLNERLLHLTGVDRRAPKGPSHAIERIVVYEATELRAPGAFEQIGGSVVAVHSPRAAKRVAELAHDLELDRARIAIAAISSEAAAVAGTGWQAIETAAEPSDAALLALAARLCKNCD